MKKGQLKKVLVNMVFTLTVSVIVAGSILAIVYGVGTILSALYHFIIGA